jgi:hypothetical protein
MAITLTTPISETKTATKIKLKNILWTKIGTVMKMIVTYTDGSGNEINTFQDFTKAQCRNIMNRAEVHMMSNPVFAGTQGDDPDEA